MTGMLRVPRPLVRLVLTAGQLVRRAYWAVTGRRGEGAHAVALTPDGEVVLVRLTYVSGWRIPGGGVGRGEDAQAAVLRELREEIGLVSHGEVIPLDGSADGLGYFLVRDVRYRPRRSYEIDEIRAFPPGALPDDMPDCTREVVEEALRQASKKAPGETLRAGAGLS